MKIFVYCDGGSRGNPGKAASAFVIASEDQQLLYKEGTYIGIATNNVAEYKALLFAFQYLVKNEIPGITEIACVFDSELLVRQATGVYKIKNETLKELMGEIKSLEKQLVVRPTYTHVRRHKNADADALVNETLDNS